MGVELELEGFGSRAQNDAGSFLHPHWNITADGSLRNGGVEFVTSGGKGGEVLHAAFERMDALLARVNYDASFRCSTHMHINMLDFTFNQVARFAFAYAACEPVLFAFCGNYRRSSNFCVPVGDSLPFHKKLVSRLFDDAILARQTHQSCNKYTAMNFLPLFAGANNSPALGTVEFRGGRPLTNLADFLTQANLLLSIKDFVRNGSELSDDEFLASITTHGVMGSVYSNGVAAGISVPQDQLDEASVIAWVLMKSYQSGRNNRVNTVTSSQRREQERSNMLSHAAASIMHNMRVDPDGIPVGASPHPEHRGHHLLATTLLNDPVQGSNAGWTYLTRDVVRDRGASWLWIPSLIPWSSTQWPALHRHLPELQAQELTLSRFLQLASTIMERSPFAGNLPPEESRKDIRAALTAVGVTFETGYPACTVDFLLRWASGRSNGVVSSLLPDRPDLNEFSNMMSMGLKWGQSLSAVDMSRLSTRYPQWCTGYVHKGRDLMLLLRNILTFTVRVKERATLDTEAERRTGERSILTTSSRRMNPTVIRGLLRLTDKSSINHIHREDLANYDSFTEMVDFMVERGCLIPVPRATSLTRSIGDNGLPTIGGALRALTNPDRYTLGWGEEQSARRVARLSATTNKMIY